MQCLQFIYLFHLLSSKNGKICANFGWIVQCSRRFKEKFEIEITFIVIQTHARYKNKKQQNQRQNVNEKRISNWIRIKWKTEWKSVFLFLILRSVNRKSSILYEHIFCCTFRSVFLLVAVFFFTFHFHRYLCVFARKSIYFISVLFTIFFFSFRLKLFMQTTSITVRWMQRDETEREEENFNWSWNRRRKKCRKCVSIWNRNSRLHRALCVHMYAIHVNDIKPLVSSLFLSVHSENFFLSFPHSSIFIVYKIVSHSRSLAQ